MKRKTVWFSLILLLVFSVWLVVSPSIRLRINSANLSVLVNISFGQDESEPSEEASTPDEKQPKIIEQEMILIKEGAFLRGTKETEKTSKINEMPQYAVRLSSFYIDKYEVSNAIYKKFVDATGHKPPRQWVDGEIPLGKENHPVIYVSWKDAVAYAKWVGKRLPTEAEWERAARGTDGRNYPWGNEFDRLKCRSCLSNIRDTAEVNEYPDGMSPDGCYNMAGNVGEWVQDRYNWRYYKKDPRPDNNPTGPSEDKVLHFCPDHGMQAYSSTGKCKLADCDKELEASRVIRGGSWSEKSKDLRCAKRASAAESRTSFKIGFRCAKNVE